MFFFPTYQSSTSASSYHQENKHENAEATQCQSLFSEAVSITSASVHTEKSAKACIVELEKPFNFYGEKCTHRYGKGIFGNRESITAAVSHLDKIFEVSPDFYHYILNEIESRNVALIPTSNSQYLSKHNFHGVWLDDMARKAKKLPREQRHILEGFSHGVLVDVKACKGDRLTEVLAHENFHDFADKIGGVFGSADPCKTPEHARKLTDSWSSLKKQYHSFRSSKDKSPNAIKAWENIQGVINYPQDYRNEIFCIDHQLQRLDKIKDRAKVKQLLKQKEILESTFRAEVFATSYGKKYRKLPNESKELLRELYQTMDEILGQKVFLEPKIKVAAKRLSGWRKKNAGPISTAVNLLFLSWDIGSAIKAEHTQDPTNPYIRNGLIRGCTRFASDYILSNFLPDLAIAEPRFSLTQESKLEVTDETRKRHKELVDKAEARRMAFIMTGGSTGLASPFTQEEDKELSQLYIERKQAWRATEKQIVENIKKLMDEKVPTCLDYIKRFTKNLMDKMEDVTDLFMPPENEDPKDFVPLLTKKVNHLIECTIEKTNTEPTLEPGEKKARLDKLAYQAAEIENKSKAGQGISEREAIGFTKALNELLPFVSADDKASLEQTEKVFALQEEHAKSQVEAAKEAVKQREQELAKKISAAFNALETVADAIVTWAVWSERAELHAERSLVAEREFDSCMRKLGLNLQISEFYHKSLPQVTDMLRNTIASTEQQQGNIWIAAAEEYHRQVFEAKEKILLWKNEGERLAPGKKFIADMKQHLQIAQRSLEICYQERSKTLQHYQSIASVVQVAGSIAASANPPAGAVIGGIASLMNVGIRYAANENESHFRRHNGELDGQRQQLLQMGQTFSESQQAIQQRLHGWAKRRHQQQMFLLQNPQYFQPHRYKLLLELELPDIKNDLKVAEAQCVNDKKLLDNKVSQLDKARERLAMLKSTTPHQAPPYTFCIEANKGKVTKVSGTVILADGSAEEVTIEGRKNCENWQKNFKEMTDLPAKIALLEGEIPSLKNNYDISEETATATSQQLKAFENSYDIAQKKCELPFHHRWDNGVLSPETQLAYSNKHLASVEKFKGSQDFTQLRQWLDAKCENGILHVYRDIELLRNADETAIRNLLPQLLLGSIRRQPDHESLLATEHATLNKLIYKEQVELEDIEKAVDDTAKAKAEEAFAPTSVERVKQSDRVGKIEETIRKEELLQSMLWDQLSQLPAKDRKAICDNLCSELDKGSSQLPQLCEVMRTTEWELWHGANDKELTGLYEIFQNDNKNRINKLKESIEQLRKKGQATYQLERSLKREEESGELLIIDAYRRESLARLREISGNNANTFEGALLSGHAQFLESVQREGFYQQLPKLSMAIEAIFRQLYGTHEKYKSRGVFFKMMTAASAMTSSLSYFYEAFHDSKRMAKKAHDKDTEATASSLLWKSSGVLINCYINPGLGALSTAIDTVQTAYTLINGGELPPTLEEKLYAISRSLTQVGKSLSQGLEVGFTTLMETLELHHNDVFLMHRQLQEKLNNTEYMLQRMEQRTTACNIRDQKRRSKDYQRTMRDQLLRLNSSLVPKQLKAYTQDIATNNMTGRDSKDILSLAEMARAPHAFIGVIADHLQPNNKITVASPSLVHFLNEQLRFAQYIGNQGLAELKEVDHMLQLQCKGLQQIYEAVPEQLKNAADALQKLAQPFEEQRKVQSFELTVSQEDQQRVSRYLEGIAARFSFTRRVFSCLNTPILDIAQKAVDLNLKLEEKLNTQKKVALGVSIGSISAAFRCSPITSTASTVIYPIAMAIGLIGTTVLKAHSDYDINSHDVVRHTAEKIEGMAVIEFLHQSKVANYPWIDPEPGKIFNDTRSFSEELAVEWVAKNGPSRIAAIGLSCIARNDLFSAPCIKEKYAHEDDPILHVTTISSLSRNKTKSYYHKDSWIQQSDIAALVKIFENANPAQWELNEKSCHDLGAAFASPTMSPNFQAWLGETVPIKPIMKGMVALPVPRSILDAIEMSLTDALLWSPRPLQFCYRWEKAVDGQVTSNHYIFSIHCVDAKGNSYCSYPLFPVGSQILDTLLDPKNAIPTDLEEKNALACAQLIYILYGQFWGIGLPSDESYLLSSCKGYVVSDHSSEKRSYYELLRNMRNTRFIHPVWSQRGKELLQAIGERKRVFNLQMKTYADYYYLSVALLRLSIFDKKHRQDTLQKYLQQCGFLEPNEELFTTLCYKDCKADPKAMMALCATQPISIQQEMIGKIVNG